MVSMQQAAKELGIGEQAIRLWIEDGMMLPGGKRLQLKAHKAEPTDPYSYQINQLDLKRFKQKYANTMEFYNKENLTNSAEDNLITTLNKYIIYIVSTCILIILITVFIGGYLWNWNWTGVNQIDKDHPGKMLWDWLSLLIVPTMLTVGGIWFGKIYAGNDRKTVFKDSQEIILQAYLDSMSELLLKENFSQCQTAQKLAEVRTWIVLRRLTSPWNGDIIRFLHNTGLITIGEQGIGKKEPFINLDGVNLEGVALRWSPLPRISLRSSLMTKADFREAQLRGARFCRCEFCLALFNKADLRETDFNNARLALADLSDADLSHANLSSAILSSANLNGADLSGAILNGTLMKGVKGLSDGQLKDCRDRGAEID